MNRADIQNTDPNVGPTDPDFDLLHHPLHALALDEQASAVGTIEADIPAFAIETPGSGLDFLLPQLAE